MKGIFLKRTVKTYESGSRPHSEGFDGFVRKAIKKIKSISIRKSNAGLDNDSVSMIFVYENNIAQLQHNT